MVYVITIHVRSYPHCRSLNSLQLLSHATCLSLANYSICNIVSLYLPDSRSYFYLLRSYRLPSSLIPLKPKYPFLCQIHLQVSLCTDIFYYLFNILPVHDYPLLYCKIMTPRTVYTCIFFSFLYLFVLLCVLL